jgi:polyisoprenoid-binding protein YceI
MSQIERFLYRSERWMYERGHPNRLAAALNRGWAIAGAVGLWPSRLVTLDVRGRRSGRHLSFPLIVADYQGERFLVAMLGDGANWVANVRAADGQAVLRHGRSEAVRLEEVDPGDRAPILKRHLEVAPGARSFVPVDRRAPLAEFARIAAQFPVFRIVPDPAPSERADHATHRPETTEVIAMPSTKPPSKRRWRRWVYASVGVLVAIVAVVVVAIGSYVNDPTPPLGLPVAAASQPVGPLEGQWEVAAGSEAGFRIQQTVLGMSGDVVGRTNAVTGNMVLAADVVSTATFTIDLSTITAAGKPIPQLALSLDTQNHPGATITLAQPVTLSAAFTSGETVTAAATGEFAMRGESHPVTFTISGRRDGLELQFAGSIPVAFSDWGIEGPEGSGFLGALADHGEAEFLLVLHRTDGTAG